MTNIEGGHSLSGIPLETRTNGESYLDFVGRQVFVVDPRGQGFGLKDYSFLDSYANKFLILAGSQGLFVSPMAIPNELLAYYDQLGLDIPSSSNVVTVESDTTLTESLMGNPAIGSVFTPRRGSFVIPYMVTPEVEELAQVYGFNTLVDSATVDHMADKARFQEELAAISTDLIKDTGYDITIPMAKFKADDRSLVNSSYLALSDQGKRDVVIVKPKSASGLGIFVLRAGKGTNGLSNILDKHFTEDEEVLIEEFIDHNHSPSMQGARLPTTDYSHLYFGRQIISTTEDHIEYDSSQIPFGPHNVSVKSQDLGRMGEVHQALGESLIQNKGIAGVAGFDAVANIMPDGSVKNFKVTELNLHLPSSLAVYAAINKVFPDGFNGVAHNMNIPLRSGETAHDFIRRNNALLVPKKHEFGIFPLNLSYSDKVDVVIFAKDSEHLSQLLGGIQQ